CHTRRRVAALEAIRAARAGRQELMVVVLIVVIGSICLAMGMRQVGVVRCWSGAVEVQRPGAVSDALAGLARVRAGQARGAGRALQLRNEPRRAAETARAFRAVARTDAVPRAVGIARAHLGRGWERTVRNAFVGAALDRGVGTGLPVGRFDRLAVIV